jgi:repressor of nif and glnA expression
MRKHASWLTQTDERVLEFVREYGNFPPSAIRDRLAEIGDDLEYSANHVGMRCRELDDHGLLEIVGGGTYSITELGEQYLNGEFDAGSLEDD